jgi:hypothetical protein
MTRAALLAALFVGERKLNFPVHPMTRAALLAALFVGERKLNTWQFWREQK